MQGVLEKPFITLNEKRFYLNKSKSKHVSVSLAYDFGFQACVGLGNCKGEEIIQGEKKWIDFLQYQGIVSNYFYSNQACEHIRTPAYNITFESLQILK